MTGFAGSDQQAGEWTFGWELRSVNHRYLDISLKLPDAVRFLEPEIRSRIGAHLKRGRIDVLLNLRRNSGGNGELSLDRDLLKSLFAAASEVKSLAGESLGTYSALDVLRWPGVMLQSEPDREVLAEGALASLETTLVQLVKVRETEGAQLASLIEGRCRQMQELAAGARKRMPQVLAALRQRLMARLAELTAKPDPDRLEQELVYLAQKLDVDEEIDRLETHLGEVLQALHKPDPVGRRLDFLLQELNREANTLGSKSADAETTKASVEMKVLIEQMREQIQNIE
ncbi:MAG: YicC family protein [Methylococcaceae bacterium]|nr:YicC family protein [Methylococcaceae bacterium]